MKKPKPLRIIGKDFRKRRLFAVDSQDITLTDGACTVVGYIKNNKNPPKTVEEGADCADYREPYKAPREDEGENAPGFAPGDVWDISKQVRSFKFRGPHKEEDYATDQS